MESNFREEKGIEFLNFYFGENEIFISVRKCSRPILGGVRQIAHFCKITPSYIYAVFLLKSSKKMLTFGAGCGSIIDTRKQQSGAVLIA